MKKFHVLSIIGLSIVAFSLITTVMATEYSLSLVAAPSANIWTISTFNSGIEPSDIDFTTLAAECNDDGTIYNPVPKKVLIQGDNVILIFSMNNLPTSADTIKVTGSLTNSVDTFVANGVGFAWGRR